MGPVHWQLLFRPGIKMSHTVSLSSDSCVCTVNGRYQGNLLVEALVIYELKNEMGCWDGLKLFKMG